jgi:hypothetical protein
MQVTTLRATDPAWDECLAGTRHDVYHTAGYHRFEQLRGGGVAYLAVVETAADHLVWPYLLRPIEIPGGPSGCCDVTSAYGYSGPLAWGRQVAEFLHPAWNAVQEVWRAQRAVSVFTRLHPLLDNRGLAQSFVSPADADSGGVLELGETVSIDCLASDESVVSAYARPLRRHLENAARLGYVTEEDVAWTDVAEFVRVYDESMDRNTAGNDYRFTREDFEFLRTALPGQVHLLLTRGEGGEVVAGGVFTQSSGIVQAHLMGTATAHLATSPGKALLDDARRWAAAAGCEVLHLGGGRGGRHDSLFRFKREFSRRRHVFAVGRWILDAGAYAELRQAHDPQAPTDTGPSSFFPAYRAPLLSRHGGAP